MAEAFEEAFSKLELDEFGEQLRAKAIQLNCKAAVKPGPSPKARKLRTQGNNRYMPPTVNQTQATGRPMSFGGVKLLRKRNKKVVEF
jgi:hypothetical protein